ncbi:hypothetical protein F2Q70_00033211, partial [Brassica cretica]
VSRLRNHGDGKNSDFTDLNNEGILKTLEQIEEKASSFLNLSPQFNHMVESLKKKEERLRVVESREKEVALLEKSVSEKSRVLEEIEMDFDMIQVLEASLLRLVIERQTEVAVRKKLEDVTSECERKKVEANACGRFEHGDTEIRSHLMFAHEMDHTKCDKSVIVNPRKGETWALFKDWDISWKSQSDLHEPPYRYDLVEVITEFDDQLGISVAYMGRVEGFEPVLNRVEQHGLIKFICPGEMQRFSHKVPAGSFKLDPAATPGNDPVLEEEVETRIQSKECGKAPTVETQEGSTKDQPIILE